MRVSFVLFKSLIVIILMVLAARNYFAKIDLFS